MTKLEEKYGGEEFGDELQQIRSEYDSTENMKFRKLNVLVHLEEYLDELRETYPMVGIVGVGECNTELRLVKNIKDESVLDKKLYTFLRVLVKYDITQAQAPIFSLMTSHEFTLDYAMDVFEDLDEQVEFKVVEEE